MQTLSEDATLEKTKPALNLGAVAVLDTLDAIKSGKVGVVTLSTLHLSKAPGKTATMRVPQPSCRQKKFAGDSDAREFARL